MKKNKYRVIIQLWVYFWKNVVFGVCVIVIRPYDLLIAQSNKKSDGGKENAVLSLTLFEDFSLRINADFSDILTIVEGYTEIALRKLREGRLTEENLQHILKTIRRGAGLTEEIKTFFEHLPDAEDRCDLVEGLRRAGEALEMQKGDDGGALQLSLPERSYLIQGKVETLTHVLAVFLPYVHGAKGTLSDVAISLEVHALKDGREQAVLNILCADDGTEIEDSMEARLFYPAAMQAHGLEKCLTRLYMAYVLVEQLGGCVCTAPGQGGRQRFQLLFPLLSASS